MPSSPPRLPRFIRIEFAPASGCLGSLVTVVTDFCRNVVDDADSIFAFQLAAYELTENLFKYASGEHAVLKIEVASTPKGPDLVLTTENHATADRLADADARLTALEQAVDPVAHFDALAAESLRSPGGSCLGLGRLRAEGELEISHHINGETLRICARRPVFQGERGLTS